MNPTPQPPPHVVAEVLRTLDERNGFDPGVVQLVSVCAWCGRIEYRGERPCRDGEAPGRQAVPWDGNHPCCSVCELTRQQHPMIFRWVTEVVAFREFVASVPLPPEGGVE